MLRIRERRLPHATAFEKREKNTIMQQPDRYPRSKGGRPKKAVKRDQLLGVKCTLIERRAIEARARSVQMTISEYLRKIGLTGKIDRSERTIPKELLQQSGTLNHAAANINQIARKRNRGEELNAIERAELQSSVIVVTEAAKKIINYL
jgi:hypothetical protein